MDGQNIDDIKLRNRKEGKESGWSVREKEFFYFYLAMTHLDVRTIYHSNTATAHGPASPQYHRRHSKHALHKLVYDTLDCLARGPRQAWIMHYQVAGSRGTIEERGLERQRKLDGLVKWNFD